MTAVKFHTSLERPLIRHIDASSQSPLSISTDEAEVILEKTKDIAKKILQVKNNYHHLQNEFERCEELQEIHCEASNCEARFTPFLHKVDEVRNQNRLLTREKEELVIKHSVFATQNDGYDPSNFDRRIKEMEKNLQLESRSQDCLEIQIAERISNIKNPRDNWDDIDFAETNCCSCVIL